MSSMVIGLAGGSLESLVVTSTVTGGAVALDMDVDIYLLLGGAYAFRKDVAGEGHVQPIAPNCRSEMRGRHERATPSRRRSTTCGGSRQDGNVRIHCCGTAGKIWGAGALEDSSTSSTTSSASPSTSRAVKRPTSSRSSE